MELRNNLQRAVLAALTATIVFSCCETTQPAQKEKDELDGFPQEIRLESVNDNSAFLLTLNSEIDTNKNCIYAFTMAQCWDEFTNKIGEISPSQNRALMELIHSSEHQNVLNISEYETKVEVMASSVDITALFHIDLPFVKELHQGNTTFEKKLVPAFSGPAGGRQEEIIFYNSDHDFALRLLPENREHEIVIVQTDFSAFRTLKEVCEWLNREETRFQKEAESWKKQFNERDTYRIPMLAFNLSENYNSLEGTHFRTGKQPWTIKKAFQQNAFVLNEQGARAYSRAEVSNATSAMPREVKTPIKDLSVTKNFVVIMKRKTSTWPYFGAFIANDRWMKKLKN